MQPLPKYLRRMLPSTARLSHNRILMCPLDLIDRIASLPFKEARGLPPNRMRIRVGVQNRILFNAFQFRYRAVGFWMRAPRDRAAGPALGRYPLRGALYRH